MTPTITLPLAAAEASQPPVQRRATAIPTREERRTTDGGRTDEERRSAVSRGESERDHCRICRRRSRRSPPTDRPTFRFQPKRTCASRPLPPSLLVAIRMIHQAAARLRSFVAFRSVRSPPPPSASYGSAGAQSEHACACVRFVRSRPSDSFLPSLFSPLSSFRSLPAFCKRGLPGCHRGDLAIMHLRKEAVAIYTQIAIDYVEVNSFNPSTKPQTDWRNDCLSTI